MAAQEYYQSFQEPLQGAPPYPVPPPPPQGGRRPSLAPVQPAYSHNYSPAPSNYAQQQFLGVPGQVPESVQPWRPQSDYPQPHYQGPPAGPQYGAALMPSRSKSEPPEYRRTSVDSYGSHKHHHHHHHNHSHSHSQRSRSRSRSRSRHHDRDYDDRDYSDHGESSRSRSRHHSHRRRSSHESRDTFLGAGAGGLIGDALLPGLGTLFGAIAGGLGGHEYAHRKDERKRRESRSNSDSAYRDGITVKSGWIRR
ncbi:uncharacterized protein PV09_07209 [Verruconis gallopava]|uniref:Glycine zipper domain-containing protein n=1 Tax=Verruconis gallopava TaxID=253628 RepID=A0A0D1XGW7_9PEZI|nr:uncharacterized protein PV09_07209 [Verruconis gallopava]KIW01451.1 hypothetical protein PV09_07209 [Verruconis gallopava]